MRRTIGLLMMQAMVGCGDDVGTDPGSTSNTSSSTTSSSSTGPAPDEDGDSYDATQDCDDADAAVNPGASETCNDTDDDCDGAIDEAAAGSTAYFPDNDLDGFGSNAAVLACSDPSTPTQAYVLTGGDCNDAESAIHPLAEEICDDSLDNDCDGQLLSGCVEGCQVTVPLQAPTITAGLALAAPGDRVCVMAGTYTEQVVMPAFAVELVGVDGRDVTFIEGDGTKPVVVFNGGDAATRLAGFTVRNGKYELSTADASGIRVVGSPTLEELVVELNEGTAVTFSNSSSVFRNSIVRDNFNGWFGGAIDVWDNADVTLEALHVEGNDGSRGGGIYLDNGSSAAISNSTFVANDGGYAGAIYLSGVGTTAVVSNVFAHGNTSGYGGGLWVSDGSLTFDHLAILANSSGYAGAVFMSDAGTVSGNHLVVAGNTGGQAFIIEEDSSMVLSHALIYRNPGGAARFNLGGALTLADSVVATNGTISCWNPPCTITGGNSALSGETIAPEVQSSGFVALAPEFVNSMGTDALQWDLHLAPTAQLVDAGSGLDPDGAAADLGPYGGQDADGWDLDGDGFPSWWQPGPYDAVAYPGLGLDCDDRDASVYPGSGC